MALLIDVTAQPNLIKLRTGEERQTLYGRISYQLSEDEKTATAILHFWRSEQDYNNDMDRLSFKEIPQIIIQTEIPPDKYINFPTGDAHTLIANMLEQGDSHPQWANLMRGRSFAGLGADTVTVVLPQ